MISSKAGFARPQRKIVNATRLPAPNKGVDARTALGSMSTENCIYTFNLVPAEFGMEVRKGYREWQIGLEDSLSFGVKSLVVFDGTVGDVDDRLFAVTNEGIWDVTILGDAPVLEIAFSIDTSNQAGHGVFAHYTDQSGEDFLFYADSKNGLFEYSETTDAWVVASDIEGPDLTKIAFVVVHKQRLWMIEQDSTVAWYLPINSKTGEAQEFFFGSKFEHGGRLLALINWSVDGGVGLDDYLVAVSTSGDVIPYRGSDPTTVDGIDRWSSVGTYFIGKIPEGRRFFSEYSGELYLLSSFGLVAMSDLLVGVDSQDKSRTSLTFPIAQIIRNALELTGDRLGWQPTFMPSLGILLITSPIDPITGVYRQYQMNLAVEGWGFWRSVPMECAAEFNGSVYFGTSDSRIMVMDVYVDGVVLDPPEDEFNGYPINYSMLTAYSDVGSAATFKRAQFIRPDITSVTNPSYQTKVLYDYSFTEVIFNIPPDNLLAFGQWDIDEWDIAIWGEGNPRTFHKLIGSGGVGRTMAVAIRGTSINLTRLISFDIMWIDGGYL